MDIWYDGTHGVSFYELLTNKSIVSITNPNTNVVGKLIGHTWKDWGLIPLSAPFFAPPEEKSTTIDVPGADGLIDVSDALTGWTLYNNREGSWGFYCAEYFQLEELLDSSYDEIMDTNYDAILASVKVSTHEKYSILLNALHGKKLAMVLDDDPTHFYVGKVKISQIASSNDEKTLNGIAIAVSAFPYKFKIRAVAKSGVDPMHPERKQTYFRMPKTIFTRKNISIPPSESDYIFDDNGANCNAIKLKVGRLPVIPVIYTFREDGQYSNYPITIDFENPELGILVKGIPWASNSRSFYPLENVTGAASTKKEDCFASNLSGNNICTITFHYDSDGTLRRNPDDYVFVCYWEGDL